MNNSELIELTKEYIKEAKRLIKDHEHEKEHEFLLKLLKEATQNIEEYLNSKQKRRIKFIGRGTVMM